MKYHLSDTVTMIVADVERQNLQHPLCWTGGDCRCCYGRCVWLVVSVCHLFLSTFPRITWGLVATFPRIWISRTIIAESDTTCAWSGIMHHEMNIRTKTVVSQNSKQRKFFQFDAPLMTVKTLRQPRLLENVLSVKNNLFINLHRWTGGRNNISITISMLNDNDGQNYFLQRWTGKTACSREYLGFTSICYC